MTKLRFNLQFFGSGGTSTQRIQKRDPEPEELVNLRKTLYDTILPTVENYDASAWQKATQQGDKLTNQAISMLNNTQGLQNTANQLSTNAITQANKANGIADRAFSQQSTLLQQLPASMGNNQTLLNELLSVVRSGNIPSALTENMNAAVNNELKSSMGNALSGLANRGVLNSSITSQGINNLSKAAANAFNQNYLSAFNSVLNGYSQGLQSSQNNTASLLSAINAIGNVPAQAYNVALGASGLANSAYQNLAQAYQNAGSIFNLGSQAYSNASNGYNALAPALSLWQGWQNSYDNREDYDTIVKQGK